MPGEEVCVVGWAGVGWVLKNGSYFDPFPLLMAPTKGMIPFFSFKNTPFTETQFLCTGNMIPLYNYICIMKLCFCYIKGIKKLTTEIRFCCIVSMELYFYYIKGVK